MRIRELKQKILNKIRYAINQRKKLMLPRKNGNLDATLIEHIVILLDENGKPVGVYAKTSNGWIYEKYTPQLYQLIISSGISHSTKSLIDPPSDENNGDGKLPKNNF